MTKSFRVSQAPCSFGFTDSLKKGGEDNATICLVVCIKTVPS